MAAGLLGKGSPLQNTYLKLYTVPNNVKYATVDIDVVNMSTQTANVSISATSQQAATITDFIEYKTPLKTNDGFTVTSLVLSPNENLLVVSDTLNVVFRVSGIEKI